MLLERELELRALLEVTEAGIELCETDGASSVEGT